MAIIDPSAIKFSNEQFRVASDKLSRCYYNAHELKDSWEALPGTNDEKFAVLKTNITNVATNLTSTFRFCWWADRIWQSSAMTSLFPNDAAQIVFDNATGTGPDPGRPTITGQDCRRLKNRMEEFVNWLQRGTDADRHWVNDATATLPITYSWFDDAARLAADGSKTPTAAWGRTLAVDRCGALVTRWETTAPADFQHILKVSVNPIGNGA